ncbi:MAG: hypothetical protein HC821_04380 [Lewinella sp.]|nr:hypothetical protein [Lewinella sp.]
MSTFLLFKNKCSPAALDEYLALGYRTTGQAVYNCNFLQMDSGEMVSVLPLRLRLSGFGFSKSLRKLLRRNLGRFRVEYGPCLSVDEEMRRVNESYRQLSPEKSLEQLDYHITGHHNQRVFNTWSTKVYDGSQLIAFSFFDLGKEAAYSKAGIYDPSYGSYSLGLFTLALEVEFCMRREMVFFYPGYVSDENATFDYKHRLGQMEFFELFCGNWLAYGRYPHLQRPLARLLKALRVVQEQLQQTGLDSRVLLYPHLDKRYVTVLPFNFFLDAPGLLLVRQTAFDRYQIVTYRPEDLNYVVCQVQGFELSPNKLLPEKPGALAYFSDALVVRKHDMNSSSAEEVVLYLQQNDGHTKG